MMPTYYICAVKYLKTKKRIYINEVKTINRLDIDVSLAVRKRRSELLNDIEAGYEIRINVYRCFKDLCANYGTENVNVIRTAYGKYLRTDSKEIDCDSLGDLLEYY